MVDICSAYLILYDPGASQIAKNYMVCQSCQSNWRSSIPANMQKFSASFNCRGILNERSYILTLEF